MIKQKVFLVFLFSPKKLVRRCAPLLERYSRTSTVLYSVLSNPKKVNVFGIEFSLAKRPSFLHGFLGFCAYCRASVLEGVASEGAENLHLGERAGVRAALRLLRNWRQCQRRMQGAVRAKARFCVGLLLLYKNISTIDRA